MLNEAGTIASGEALKHVPPHSGPSRGEMARSLFSKSFLQKIGLHAEVRINPLQPTVLVLDGLHLADQRRIHAAILRTPLVERRIAHAMLAAQLGHRNTAFGLPQDREDLFIGAYAAPSGATVPSSSVYLLVFIQNLLVHLAEKTLLMQPLTFGGDYPFFRRVVGRSPSSPLLAMASIVLLNAMRGARPSRSRNWRSGSTTIGRAGDERALDHERLARRRHGRDDLARRMGMASDRPGRRLNGEAQRLRPLTMLILPAVHSIFNGLPVDVFFCLTGSGTVRPASAAPAIQASGTRGRSPRQSPCKPQPAAEVAHRR